MLLVNFTWVFQVVKLMRVKHWLKSGFVFLPLIFSEQVFVGMAWVNALLAFLLFCLCSSAIYVVNDIFDASKDCQHPIKKHRPIASGFFSPYHGWIIATNIALLALLFSMFVTPVTRLVVLGYFVMNVAYSLILKHEVLLDVFIIAIGFVLRVVAGGVALGNYTTSWLVLVTFFIALFLALGKRRHELLFVDLPGGPLRPVLEHYNEKLLDYLIIISATLTIITYSLYVMLNEPYVYTLPFVIFGMFRYLLLVYTQESGGDPTDTLSRDKVIIMNVGVWSLLVTGLFFLSN